MQCRAWQNVTRDQKCLCLVVSLKHSLPLTAVLSVGLSHSTSLPDSLSQIIIKKTNKPYKSSQFCLRWWWKSYFKTYAHWCTRTTEIHIQYYWSHAVTHDGETLKNILVHCSFSFSRHLCIFASTINSVLACKHTHIHTHSKTDSHTAE